MGNTIDRLYDVGIAGIHRLLHEHTRLSAARARVDALLERLPDLNTPA